MITINKEQKDKFEQLLQRHDLGGPHVTHGLEQDFKCVYCDIDYLASFDAFHSIEIEHIIPECCGGDSTEENTAISCRNCNWIKGTRLPIGNSREERIADARHHVKQERLRLEDEATKRLAEVTKIRLLIRGDLPIAHNHAA